MSNNTSYLIQTTANELFRENGYANVTIDDICTQAGITKSTFYYHYNAKDDLLMNFFENAGKMPGHVMATLATSDDYWEKLWASVQLAVDWATGSGKDLLRNVLIYDLQKANTSFSERPRIVDLHTAIIKKGQETGRFRNLSPATELYENISVMFIGTLFQWCSSEDPEYDRANFKARIGSLLNVSDE